MPRVLLVEDNEMNRDMLSRRLARREYEVLVAVDGREGVVMAGSEAPDLILMDMSLPVMDGWEATRQLKASPETKAIPIIALTAHAMSGDREKAIEAGCDDFENQGSESLRSDLEKIHSAGGQLLALVNDALDPAKVEAGDPDLDLRHDLRTPINSIIGYSEMLQEEAETLNRTDIIPDLQKIRSAAERFLFLIDDVVDFSRIEAGEMAPHLQASDTAAIIQGAMT